MKTPFDEEFFDDAGKEEAPDKIFQALKEQHHTHESIEFDDRFFEIVTTLEQKTRSWAYTSSIRLDGQQLEELNFPPHRGSERTTDSEEEVPAALIYRAAEAHLLQCANVRHLIETEGRKKRRKLKQTLLLAATLMVVLIAGGGSWYWKQRPTPRNTTEDPSADRPITVTPQAAATATPGTTQSGTTSSDTGLVSSMKVVYRSLLDTEFQAIVEGETLLSKDVFKIRFRALQDGYLYLFQVDTTGMATRLFPMEGMGKVIVQNRNPIQAGTDYTLPSETQAFELDKVQGTETFYVFTFLQPQEWLETPENATVPEQELLQNTGNSGDTCDTCVDVFRFEHQ